MVTHQPSTAVRTGLRSPAQQAFMLLRTVFTIAPILFGLDKFTNLLTDWTQYLAPVATEVVPVSAQQFMWAVGVVEILAGLLVAWRPRIGSLVVAAWLAGIIINLLVLPGFFDVALRDFGLLVGALALNRLATDRASRKGNGMMNA
ncbi:hypothetical protein D477_016080 [Arthrobacter crystallopoietes BAB-32]|uniref:Transmembrane protein n=1 Tax=Arthrobacter crystallopoietes BAB-32 TaxID=1246476 RepID=N1URZ9_9MICC|nr:hypothetical protein [Arthrobacter crystallopoietes]EMY33191.1 hypothetical protein D477_016080 [Arthrobacter crystallopoietes BAB-32]